MYESRLIEASMISASISETTTRNSQGREFNPERRPENCQCLFDCPRLPAG